jgi:TRAP transporter TAXI family solute receptor
MEVVGAAIAELLNKNIEGIGFTAVPSGGTAVNVNLLRQGDGEVAFLTGDVVSSALNGTDPFTEKYPELRSMFALYSNTLQIWTRSNIGVSDFRDLKNKRFTYGKPGSGAYQTGINLMKVYGITEEDVRKSGGEIIPLAWNESVGALQDGNLDAVLWSTSYPAARVVDAQTMRELPLLQINPAMLEAFKKEVGGWIDITIPKNTYKGQATDIKTVGTLNMLAVTDKLSDDIVYKMTKTLWENREQLGIVIALLKDINAAMVARGMGAPLHPGAKRYYTEAGIPTD